MRAATGLWTGGRTETEPEQEPEPDQCVNHRWSASQRTLTATHRTAAARRGEQRRELGDGVENTDRLMGRLASLG